MEHPDDLFPPKDLPHVGVSVLRSLKLPEKVAWVQICAHLVKVFRPGAAVGGASIVDAVRLFGNGSCNTARGTIAVVAGLAPGVQIPPGFSPERGAVKAARQSIARRILPLWDQGRLVIQRFAEGLE